MMGSVWDIARKQVEDSFSSRRFLFILALFLLFSLGSVYVGVDKYQNSLEQYKTGFSSMQPEKPGLLDTFQFMFKFNMPVAAGLLALLLSYDAISIERSEGTIELLLSYPIYRDEVINGKFIASIFTVALALLISFTASAGYAIYSIGLLPTMEEFSRLSFIWFSTVIYMAFFIGLGTLFSTLFRSRWRSLIACLFVFLIFLAVPVLSGYVANIVYPYDNDSGSGVSHARAVGGPALEEDRATLEEERRREQQRRDRIQAKRESFEQTVSKLSPTTSYRNFAESMIGLNYRSEVGASPTLRQNLVSSIGYLFYLISQTAMVFTASYAVFMRQDL